MSDNDPFPYFSAPCKRCFAFLTERYGFSEPKEEQFGRERFIIYQKRDRFVSIAYELFGKPVVEFYHSSFEPKNRISLKRPTRPLLMKFPKRKREWEEKEIEQYLQWCAEHIEESEQEFVS